MEVVLSHPTGNANVRAAVYGLAKANCLAAFYTSIAVFNGSILDRMGSIDAFSEVRRRKYDNIIKPFTRTRSCIEWGRIMATKMKLQGLIQHEKGRFSIDAVYKDLDRLTAHYIQRGMDKRVTGVYAYEDGSECSFQKAKALNLQCLYDLPIGYWRAARALLAKEKERRPEWFTTITGFEDSNTKLLRKDRELCLADRIFVASQFTADTLNYFPGVLPPVEVIPYGFPPVSNEARGYNNIYASRLKILYVGSLSQRKGIADLFAVVEKLGQFVSLTIVGQKVNDNCPELNKALAQHKWFPSLPHNEVLQLMQIADVLVFPSLFEGFGLVITEAMSQGTPVITTERTAGPDLITPGENGWIIEAGNETALLLAIEHLLNNRKSIALAGRAAIEKAKTRPWEIYGAELSRAIKNHFLQV